EPPGDCYPPRRRNRGATRTGWRTRRSLRTGPLHPRRRADAGRVHRAGPSRSLSPGRGERCMSRAAVSLLLVAVGLTSISPVSAQPRASITGDGTHAFRAIINKFKLQPLNREQFTNAIAEDAGRVLLVVLGKAEDLDRFAPNELGNFIRNGGA